MEIFSACMRPNKAGAILVVSKELLDDEICSVVEDHIDKVASKIHLYIHLLDVGKGEYNLDSPSCS